MLRLTRGLLNSSSWFNYSHFWSKTQLEPSKLAGRGFRFDLCDFKGCTTGEGIWPGSLKKLLRAETAVMARLNPRHLRELGWNTESLCPESLCQAESTISALFMRSLGGKINPVTGLQQFETLKVLLHALFHLISISLYRGSYYHLHFQEEN